MSSPKVKNFHTPPSSEKHWPVTADGYEILESIGSGSASKVYHARCKTESCDVAIKMMDLDNCPLNLDEIRSEIQQMKLCLHPNVVKYYCSFVHESNLWVIMEYMTGGSVADIMNYAYHQGLPDEVLIATILQGSLRGLDYMHSTGRIHRDIKSGNILIGSDGIVKVADFGVSAWLMENGVKRNVRHTFVGTPCWMAPEVMEQVKGYDHKADIWSLGITAMELAKGKAPLAEFQPMKVLLMTLQNPPPSLEGPYSRVFKDFVKACLQKEPTRRPSASKLLEHKFIHQAKGPEYVFQTLIKRLPPLWVRLKSDPMVSSPSSLSLDSLNQESWTFDLDDTPSSVSLAIDIPLSSIPISIPPVSTQSISSELLEEDHLSSGSSPSKFPSTGLVLASSSVVNSNHASDMQRKGRFVISHSTSSNPLSKQQQQQQSQLQPQVRQEQLPFEPQVSVIAEPIRGASMEEAVSMLQLQVTFLLEENERLRKENQFLRSKLG